MSSQPRNNKVHLEDVPEGYTPIHSKVNGTFPFLNPTHIPFRHPDFPEEAHFLWRSRDNRKGRHAIALAPSIKPERQAWRPSMILWDIFTMLTEPNYWDISWWVAVLFTLGSVVWCVNGFFSWLPLQSPGTEFKNETNAAGITAFIGATIFEIGSVLLMLEAVNENRTACFGWSVKRDLELLDNWAFKSPHGKCGHRRLRARWLRNVPKRDQEVHDDAPGESGSIQPQDAPQWQWYPSLHDLRTHYLHQIGFLACSFQMFGATVFWISGFTALPNVIDMENTRLANGVFWTPQVIGGSGFIVSSWLFMLETQTSWWKPELGRLGWHIGFWNLIGAIGFTLCGALGYGINNSGVAYQSALATFWGSWAFLIGSLIQWYEAMSKHPVETVKED